MILITGGAGYVGSVLTAKLVTKGYKVRVLDSLVFGSKSLDNIKHKIELVKGDIRKPPENIFHNIKIIYHLAGLSNDPTANFDPKANYEINTLATINLAKIAKKKGAKRFIFASSCSIYDQSLFKENKLLNETSRVNPKAYYSASKFKAEQGILKLNSADFTVSIIRKGTVYGYSPRLRYDLVINTMVKDALQKGIITIYCRGKQWRPMISVNDAVGGYLLLLNVPKFKISGQIFNLLVQNYQIKDLGYLVQKTLSKYIKVKIQVLPTVKEFRSYKVSNQKIKKILNFKTSESTDKAIRDLYHKIYREKKDDFDNPNYYNIKTLINKCGKTKKNCRRYLNL